MASHTDVSFAYACLEIYRERYILLTNDNNNFTTNISQMKEVNVVENVDNQDCKLS